MKQRRTENFILLLVSLACLGLSAESVLLGWEFWVPPIIIIYTALIWIMNITERPHYDIRKVCYLAYAVFALLYHGVHATSFFDLAIVASAGIMGYAFFNDRYMLNIFLGEYITLVFVQIYYVQKETDIDYSPLNISRIVLHFMIVLIVYLCSMRGIEDRTALTDENDEKDRRIAGYESDMEDFLSNISHELRTPVNVVNGMSDLLIKRKAGNEAYAIKDAGIRLAYQIEDIQDYTECKRKDLLLEEEDYMSTSLMNDVVTSFRMRNENDALELVVDMSPMVPSMLRGDVKKLHKIFRHLLENAIKFTKRGGICVRMFSEKTDYGVNLCIEMEDTGIGMDMTTLDSVSEGMYQANKKRNRSSGGIGLGLYIVYGFVHSMGGFVKIESEKGSGTLVRVTIPQKVTDATPCLSLEKPFEGCILFHVRSDKYSVPRVRDFYRFMATNLAQTIGVPLYSAETINDIERLSEKMNVSYIFMGQEEYEANPTYIDELSHGDVVVAVSAFSGFRPRPGSEVVVMPKPLYSYPVIRVLNEGLKATSIDYSDDSAKPDFSGLSVMVVDDEPMNLVVARSIFTDYDMIVDTASSGAEAIKKYREGKYDIVFMDHMMPEMDGVEAMRHIRQVARELGRDTAIVALTANVVSGAKEMFINEGFDGFIAKPIDTSDFERVIQAILRRSDTTAGGIMS